MRNQKFTASSTLQEVEHCAAFNKFGRLLFPVDRGYYSGSRLADLELMWYAHPDTQKTVDIVNTLRANAEAGDTVFFDIYTEQEMQSDPRKRDTGLFFFRGKPWEKVAFCNAGGGFAYVGAMQDSFPHALELSRMGYNAFALIYRPGWETAMEDLERAIQFVYEHALQLQVSMEGYSLWGGSAGARMAATLGNLQGLRYYAGNGSIPQAGAVIMQYTGHSEVSPYDAPTYTCVGDNDWIANWRVMQRRLQVLTRRYGIPTEFHVYHGLSHGFGLGTGTVAEGWIHDAVAFWEAQVENGR